MDALIKKLGKYKYLLLVLLVGLVLVLLPSRSSSVKLESSALGSYTSDEEARLEAVLARVEGVGRVSVLLSEEGAAVVCEGAGSPQVCLNVVDAVTSYTGLSSNQISIIKMNTTKQEA